MQKGEDNDMTGFPMGLPADPMMLYSVLNTKLRDEYPNLKKLCEDMHINEEDITQRLSMAGFEYDEELNQFR